MRVARGIRRGVQLRMILKLTITSETMSKHMTIRRTEFGFGLEAEYLLIEKNGYRPLFCDKLDSDDLLRLVEEIPVSDISKDGFNIKPLHRQAIPYLIEGYYLTDDEMKPLKLLPKGIELRTPIAPSINEAIETLRLLTGRLSNAVASRNWALCCISHHPIETDFQAKRNYRRDDYWQWALTAMTTFGPDINISLPSEIAKSIDLDALERKINYYMPPLVALTFASPFEKGRLWEIDGKTGLSVRTYKRSTCAPLFYVHEKPELRFEFKGFEMPLDFEDYAAFFLTSLAILLDPALQKSASNDDRIAQLRKLAINGVGPEESEIAQELITSARKIAKENYIPAANLSILEQRLKANDCPSKMMIEKFLATGSIENVLHSLTDALGKNLDKRVILQTA